MTTGTLADKPGEGRVAVAIETMLLIVAAIGLCLGLLAAPGGDQSRNETDKGETRVLS